jgi:hypothetical protein
LGKYLSCIKQISKLEIMKCLTSRKRITFSILPIILIWAIISCAVPMTVNLKKHQSHYVPPKLINKRLIYIYREYEFRGSARGIYVKANGNRIGALNSGTYFVYEVTPGRVVISLENRLGDEPLRIIDVKARKSYYLRCSLKEGAWDASPYIEIVIEREGEQAIKSLTYATLK